MSQIIFQSELWEKSIRERITAEQKTNKEYQKEKNKQKNWHISYLHYLDDTADGDRESDHDEDAGEQGQDESTAPRRGGGSWK